MKKRFLLLLCALLALPVFASAEDVLMLSGAALNAAQTIAADDSLIITETITDEEGTSVTVLSHRLNGAVSKWLKQAMRGSAFFRNIFGQTKTECRKNGTQGIIFIRNSKWNEL